LITPGSPAGGTVHTLGERALIERLVSRFPPSPLPFAVGIGDDAAVVRPVRNALEVLTTDAQVESIHFDRRFSTLEDAGYRALAVTVSDIAAMGGVPRLALVSLLLPGTTTVDDVEALGNGLGRMARDARIGIAGGNISRTPGPLTIDITVTGTVGSRKFLTRGGGRAGDYVYVSGTLGAAAAGLDWLRVTGAGSEGQPEDVAMSACVARYRRPEPRARLGALLGRTSAATACMDLSDGLADAATQVAGASRTGIRLDAEALPIDPGATAWFGSRGVDALVAALSSGDDYELVFTVPPKGGGRLRSAMRLAQGLRVTKVGVLTREPDIVLMRNGRPERMPRGFEHF
jgi:thiamine-monophosphate kinase